jgi:hypothetical protein
MTPPDASMQAAAPRPAPIGSILLTVAAALLYVPMLMAIYGGPPVDPRNVGPEDRNGAGIAALFALFFGTLLWIVLGILLRLGATRGDMPRAWGGAAVVIFPLAAFAAWLGAATWFDVPGGWSILVPALLPPLIAAYSLFVRLSALSRRVPPPRAASVGLGAIALVSAAALPLLYLDHAQFPAHAEQRRQDMEAEWTRLDARRTAEAAQRERDEAAKYQTLTTASPLADYLHYLHYVGTGTEQASLYQRVLDDARHVTRREADAVGMLDTGQIDHLQELWELDLATTPKFCASLDRALVKVAASDEVYDWTVGERLELQLPNLKFFAAAHCDLDAGLAAGEARVRKITEQNRGDQRWEKFLAALGALRSAR